jgi:hypothetical protein
MNQMMKNNLARFFLLLTIISPLSAEDKANHHVMDQIINKDAQAYEIDDANFKVDDDAFLPGGSSFYDKEETKEKANKQIEHKVSGAEENSSQILTFKNEDLLDQFKDKGHYLFSFGFHMDTYDWEDTRGRFQRTFEDSTGSIRPGSLLLGFQRYLFHSYINGTIGFNTGFGFSKGKAIFTTGEVSDTTLTLWQFPVELGLGLEIPLSSYFKLFAEGGPMGLALLQNRDDRESGEKGKNVRQFGYGYFAKAKFGISLSRFLSQYGHNLYSNYQITDSYLNFEIKMIDISNFKEESISVSGTSFGLGFSFEYL